MKKNIIDDLQTVLQTGLTRKAFVAAIEEERKKTKKLQARLNQINIQVKEAIDVAKEDIMHGRNDLLELKAISERLAALEPK